MDWTTYVRAILAESQTSPDDDVAEELGQHAATAFEAARADGLSAADAEMKVRRQVDLWCRDPRVLARRPRRPSLVEPPASASRGWTGIAQDLRYGLRLLGRQPGFAFVAILMTALGIGATTTLFSVTYGVLRRPLPWAESERLVQLSEAREGATRQLKNILTNATYLAWREQPATIEGLAAWGGQSATVTTGGQADRIRIVSATASLFDVLWARPMLGDVFGAADETQGGTPAVVLSFGLWQRRFGGQPQAVGRTLDLDGRPHRIVGVMPRDFVFPDRDTQAWTPRSIPPVVSDGGQGRSISVFQAIGRLRPGVSAAQCAAEGTARGRHAPDLGMAGIAMFGTRGAPTITAVPYLDALTADVKPALVLLLAAVGLLLVTAIANIAGMQLARATSRRREIAIRAALGAGTGRLARQLLAENAVLGLAGGLAGLAISYWLHRLLPSLLPADFPRMGNVMVDWRVMAFAIAAALVASLVFGLVPTLITRRLGLVEVLAEDSLAPVGGGRRSGIGRARALIMAGQVATAAMLLIGASLLVRSFIAMLSVDRGFEPRSLLTATLPLPGRSFTGPQRAALLDSVLDDLARVPGVEAAATSNVLPLVGGEMIMGFSMRSAHARDGGVTDVHTAVRIVSPGYFRALGMRVVEGRALAEGDTRTSPPVLVVNRAFARSYLAGSPVGARLPFGLDGTEREWEVVGVVDDVRQRGPADAPQPEIFVTYRQMSAGVETDAPVLVARASTDPASLVPALRSIVRDRSPAVALDSVMTMEERLHASLARPRLYAVVLAAFAGFALLIAGIGLFGVLAYSVAQRSREIGVRAALGARPIDITLLVVRQGMAMTAAGLIVGLAAALMLARYAGSLLYGVSARDPLSFVVVPLALLAVAAMACYAPARRAVRLDPLRVLRSN